MCCNECLRALLSWNLCIDCKQYAPFMAGAAVSVGRADSCHKHVIVNKIVLSRPNRDRLIGSVG